jgi:hypothetical protein
MASDYEVLLRRGNGHNKTVTITDCYSEQEARETAESMYGMEVLRVIWKGRGGGSTTSYSAASPPPSDRSSGGDFDALGVIALLAVLMVVYFVVSFWYVLIPLAIIAFIVWSFMLKDDD